MPAAKGDAVASATKNPPVAGPAGCTIGIAAARRLETDYFVN
jgi:hypothetical protein